MAGDATMNSRSALIKVATGILVAGICLGTGTSPVAAGEESSGKPPGPTSTREGLSTDSLDKQITDLDAQIQKLRDQSLDLQEKTRAKLQAQLEILRKQQDTLIPRIEKLRSDSETAWEEIKENIQKAVEDLKLSVDSLKK